MSSVSHNEDLRQVEHIAPIAFAFLLPYLSWGAALGMASAAVAYALVSPRLIRATRRSDEAAAGFSSGKLFYALAILSLLLLFGREPYIVAIVWANLAVGDAVSNLAGRRYGRRRLPWNQDKSWIGLGASIAASALAGYLLVLWIGLPPEQTTVAWRPALLSITTSIVCSFAETLPLPLDDNLTLCIAGGAFLFWLTRARIPPSLDEYSLATGLGISAVVGLLALLGRTLTIGGGGAGVVLGTIVFYSMGWQGFLLLGVFFIFGSLFSKIGYEKKAVLGVAQPDRGRRSARHVLGKGFAAGTAALAAVFLTDRGPAAVGFTAAVATALCDTTATELGQLQRGRVILLTSFSGVPRGTPGGVSIAGSALGLGAALLVAAGSWLLGLVTPRGAAAAWIAAAAAVHMESYLVARAMRTRTERPDPAWMNAFHTTLAMLLAPIAGRVLG